MRRRKTAQRKRDAQTNQGATRKSQRKRTPSKNSVAHTNKRRKGKTEIQKRQSRKSVGKPGKKIVLIPTPEGTHAIAIRGSRRTRQASALGEYWNAVHHYLQTGDASRLKKFRGKSITDVHRVRFPLLTDTDELDRLASAGVLSFESLYARSA